MRDGNGEILARWEADPMHAMGIDSAGNIYAGMTQQGCVNKYARVH
ncbi:MAG: hypothetical protein ACXW2I_20245 [Burkholderiales bacterium]